MKKIFTYVTTHILNSEASSVSELPIYQAPYPLSYQAIVQPTYQPSTGMAVSHYSAVYPPALAPEFGLDYSDQNRGAGDHNFQNFPQ